MPPQELLKKVINKLNTKVQDKFQKSRDLKKNTHIDFDVPLIQNSYLDIKELDASNIDIKVAQYLSKMYIEHRFDLLGSGWVKNTYDTVALGVEGYKYDMNIKAPKSIADDYEPIDWQKDYKSGYRWSQKTWYKDHPIGHKLGVDIKVPWELARLQHLPQLAIFCTIGENLKEQNIKEFKYQVLDFIENNPPRMGVNWVCTMDVGIRAANMLVAYDMVTQIDNLGVLDNEFRQIFVNSIYEHGIHIINNLEISTEGKRSNHYLSNIVGLLYVSSYLEKNNEINKWLEFSIEQIKNEMDYQFYEDGGNFESSSSYHRLSGELIVYATALVLRIKGKKLFSPDYKDKLYKIGRFTLDITKPNKEIHQFGDNDSGRLFRFSPIGKFITNKEAVDKYLNLKKYKDDNGLYWDENSLNHQSFISTVSGLFQDNLFETDISFEKSFIQSLSGTGLTPMNKEYSNVILSGINLTNLEFKNTKKYHIKYDINNLKSIIYPHSGVCIFKSESFYLSICFTPLGQNGNGGHKHNDILSYELIIDGKEIVRDAGTYLYTPLPNKRNEFRSINAHNVPIVNDIEHNSWNDGMNGLFMMNNNSNTYLKEYGTNFMELILEYKDIKVLRRFDIKEDSLVVTDTSNKEFKYSTFNLYSNGYGKVEQI